MTTRPWMERLWRVFGDGDAGSALGAYIPEKRAIRTKVSSRSLFGETLVVERTPVIELNSSYGTSALRDVVVTENGGTSALANTGEIQLQTGTNANGLVKIDSAEVGRYQPGYSAGIGIGLRVATPPTGTQEIRWGGLSPNENDGVYFLYDADGLAIVRLNGGVETVVRQADWNQDKLDGTGDSKITLNPAYGKIYQIDFAWYGYGAIVYGVVDGIGPKKEQEFVSAHQLTDFSDTSIRSPNLRVFVEVKNGGTTASNLDVRLGGRQYSVVGRYLPRFRPTGERRVDTTPSTTVQPLVSFRRKSAFNDRSIKLAGYSMTNIGNSSIYVEIRLGGTLTGASFGTPSNYTASETALESDVSATAISGGNILWAGDIIGAGQQNSPAFADRDVSIDIPDGSTITLCAASFSGAPSVISGFRMREEW